jgi:hypothetical protein
MCPILWHAVESWPLMSELHLPWSPMLMPLFPTKKDQTTWLASQLPPLSAQSSCLSLSEVDCFHGCCLLGFLHIWLPSDIWRGWPTTRVYGMRPCINYLTYFMFQKCVYFLLKINFCVLLSNVVTYFCYWYFTKSWNQIGILRWNLFFMFMTVLFRSFNRGYWYSAVPHLLCNPKFLMPQFLNSDYIHARYIFKRWRGERMNNIVRFLKI